MGMKRIGLALVALLVVFFVRAGTAPKTELPYAASISGGSVIPAADQIARTVSSI